VTPSPAPLTALAQLLAASPALAEPLAGIERAAATDSPILVTGEPGSGRSTVARAIHRTSPRSAGPLVELDPGSLPAGLLEGELFGWVAGAFTGADRAGEGRVGQAAGGSLLLDHVEELPVGAQPKLLRLVAERRYAPLGGAETTADVRFLAIGGDDLARRIESGAFRLDLYHRLGVFAFRLPPLRDRRDELPALTARLLADLGERFGRPAPELAPEALSWMREYPWPGNLTELRNVLERALILGPEKALRLAPPRPAGMAGDRPRPLAEVERQEIRRALAYTRGHQGLAAELLGLSRKGLWQKRKRHGIP
jgi:DNA-binding NtrC family response regulator